MKKLAIVSSYGESCGNASYTHVLKKAFSKHLDVEVLPLDLFVIQKCKSKFGDNHIKEIAEKLKGFDFVNIQFEAGLYGSNHKDIIRRVRWLIEASPNLVLTMHRIDPPINSIGSIVREYLFTRSIGKATRVAASYRWARLYRRVVKLCATASAKKNVWVKVHTKRERRIVREIFGFSNVVDYPLSFLQPSERQALKNSSHNIEEFKARYGFPTDAKIIGTFGYVSGYKGFETAVKALAELPANYYLGIFGSQHPQTIRDNKEIDEYLAKLINLIDTVDKRIRMTRKAEKASNSDLEPQPKPAQSDAAVAANKPPLSLTQRVKFIGSLSDENFIDALRTCDAVVLPYLEVGQSMSGVIALATEVGAKMYCSNNLSFMEVARYYGEAYQTFDIGNHLELAYKIAKGSDNFDEQRERVYQTYNIEKSIELQIACFEGRQTARE